LALVENLQRENLSPLETAAAYQALMDGFGLTRERLARRLGKSRTAVTNTLRLVHLPERIQALLNDGKLSEGHARALLGLETKEQMTRLAQRVVDEKLSVRKTEELVREMLGSPGETSSAMPQRGSTTPDEFHQASRLLREALELPVRVKGLKSGGKVEIRFRRTEELKALVSLLTSRIDT
ncbi:MAG TPA: ParB/RepB/Spo0J family partition protein, partial [Rubrobacter sp.]|nr:ParB/RepB/Spo0J family partition protein [Rubrobacter sp.]